MKALWTQLPGREPAPKKRKRMRRVSRKRAKELRLYTPLRRAFLATRPICERCGKASTDVHHRFGRGPNFLNVSTWAASCNPCNLWAKDNPVAARTEGWICPKGQWMVRQPSAPSGLTGTFA